MKYYASEELANVLIRKGFVETTEKSYPKHYKLIKEKGYDPAIIKRKFSYGNNASILFDYVDITGYGDFMSFSTSSLELHELKSIFTYLEVPTYTKYALKKRCKHIFNIADEVVKISEDPEWFNRKTDQVIIRTYNAMNF